MLYHFICTEALVNMLGTEGRSAVLTQLQCNNSPIFALENHAAYSYTDKLTDSCCVCNIEFNIIGLAA